MDHTELGDIAAGSELPGKPVSLWVATTPGTDYPALGGDVAVDVAVLGGGITGIATAYMLKQAGASVAVVEAGRVVKSVTGNTTAKITSLHALVYDHLVSEFGEEKARLYGEAQETAKEKIASLVEQLGIDCDFRRASAYTYTLDERERGQVEREVDAAKRLGLPAAYTEETELPFRVRAAVRFDNQAQFHPRKYLLALAEKIPGGGSHVFEGTRATDVEDGDTCVVKS